MDALVDFKATCLLSDFYSQEFADCLPQLVLSKLLNLDVRISIEVTSYHHFDVLLAGSFGFGLLLLAKTSQLGVLRLGHLEHLNEAVN